MRTKPGDTRESAPHYAARFHSGKETSEPIQKFWPNEWPERIQLAAAFVLQLAIVIVTIRSLIAQNWLVAFTGLVVFALSFVPAIVERSAGVHLPVEFTLIVCAFLYAAYGLGEVRGFYEKFWWWDLTLHSFSALVMGMIGFLAIYVFYMTHRVRMEPIYVALVSFCFAVTTGALWELFEFAMDWFFGMRMQQSGLVDTMTDMMVDMVGAFVAAVIGYRYVKGGDSLIADRMVRKFVEGNPKIFRRDPAF